MVEKFIFSAKLITKDLTILSPATTRKLMNLGKRNINIGLKLDENIDNSDNNSGNNSENNSENNSSENGVKSKNAIIIETKLNGEICVISRYSIIDYQERQC
ncbi:hypothetical protein PIROE2DRAFT_17736 [Piromyces sp. E2]|nr:hypothetical protein PIROE2DRAFT_17736 [Piromyces sp. E2]|eukprot:OUM57321.1 hypothetical protein PIROE2DRAFT_17736 [Piromyces sp. E2]